MLTFIPTPIGNLEDVTLRSLRTLQEAEVFFCEDTRVTKQLLRLFADKFSFELQSQSTFISFHSHNQKELISNLDLNIFEKKCVFVSDAGMPCVSDPGALLVEFCVSNCIDFEILPGVSALPLAYSYAGIDKKEFLFIGFLPSKGKDREDSLKQALSKKIVTIFYESPHRIEKFAQELEQIAPKTKVVFLKELTKLHQKVIHSTGENIVKDLKSINLKGEWCIVVDAIFDEELEEDIISDIASLDAPIKDLSKILSKLTNKSPKEWYKKLLDRV